MLISCSSSKESPVQNDRKLYESVNLEYALSYPSNWAVFEASDFILISSNKDNMILPQNEVLKNDDSFLMTLVIEENIGVGDLISYLKSFGLSNTMSDDGFFLREKAYNMYGIKGILSENINTELKIMYNKLFQEDFEDVDSFGFWKNGAILGHTMDLEQGVGSIIMLSHVKDNIYTILKIVYNARMDIKQLVAEGIGICESVFLL